MYDMTPRLSMLKVDLGMTVLSDDQAVFLSGLLTAAEADINRTGVSLNPDDTTDDMLVCMYAAWMYRKRAGGDSGAMPEMIRRAMHNRLASQKMRATDNAI